MRETEDELMMHEAREIIAALRDDRDFWTSAVLPNRLIT